MVLKATTSSEEPKEDYRGQWPQAYFDDKVWFHGIVTEKFQRERRAAMGMSPSYSILWQLINMGVGDMDTVEQLWDASTRSNRYAAALADRLLEQIDKERERVSIPLLSD